MVRSISSAWTGGTCAKSSLLVRRPIPSSRTDRLGQGQWRHGTFYRSRHELIFAFKNGAAPHINSFELGQHGRYRTNVWQYKGVNTLRPGRMDELALHPTVKPVQLIADAIKDVSQRGGIVLDLFGGSGSTLIAAHKTGRRAFLCELDPVYCDRIIRRWETYAKDDAEQLACGIDVSAGRPRKAA
jgi:DNA modification methylase